MSNSVGLENQFFRDGARPYTMNVVSASVMWRIPPVIGGASADFRSSRRILCATHVQKRGE